MHPGLPFLGGGEVVDLELHAVAVGIAVVHGRRGAVVDAEEGTDALLPGPDVVVEQFLQRAERERDVVEPGGLGRLHAQLAPGGGVARGQRAEVDEGDAVVLVVIGHEGEMGVLVDDVTAEHRAVPVTHLRQAVGLEHDVGELGWGHDSVLLVRRRGITGRIG